MKHTKGKWEVDEIRGCKVVVCGSMVIASDLFDEIGSVYAFDIIFAEIDGTWKPVEHTEKQTNLRKQLKLMGF